MECNICCHTVPFTLTPCSCLNSICEDCWSNIIKTSQTPKCPYCNVEISNRQLRSYLRDNKPKHQKIKIPLCPKKRRELHIKLLKKLYKHTLSCKSSFCPSKSCRKMKEYIQHHNSYGHDRNECGICRHVAAQKVLYNLDKNNS